MQSLLKKTSLLPSAAMGRGGLLLIFFLLLGTGLGFGQTIVIDDGGGVNTSETGTADTFTVVLDAQPTTDVVLNVVSGNINEGTVDASPLTFTNSNWNVSQTVTVTGVDDAVVDGTVTYNITVSVDAANSDDAFDGLAAQTVSVDNADDDVAGFTITESGGTTATSETGTADTFTVVLDAQPATDVVLDVVSGNINEGTVDASPLTFTNSNWNVPQTVTVTGVDDAVVDGTVTYNITVSVDAANSNDAFDGLAAQTVSVDNADDDVAGFTITESGGTTATSETGTADTFTVVLDAQPATDVVLDVVSGNTNEGTVDTSPLTFTNANWNAPQTVTVTGVDDAVVDGTVTYDITISVDAANSDDDFDLLAAQTVSVDNADDDAAGFTITESAGNTITSEAVTTDTFTVVLDAQPTTNVVIDVVSEDTGEGDVSTGQLIFTNVDWDTPQTITVTGIDDDIIDGTQSYDINISVNAVASDDAFDLLAELSVSVDNTDNDTAGITITETDGNTITSEDGGTDTFDVVLDAQPATNVVIDIASEDTSEGTVSPPSLTFTSGNWDTPQTVTVTGVDDAIIDGDEAYNITVSVNNGASDNDFNNISEGVPAENTDNDSASFTIVETDGSTNTSEDETTDTFTVVLDIQPNNNVVFDIVSDDTGEATVSPQILIFTPANWDTPQTVTVTGDDDFFVDGPQTVDITISVDNSNSANAFNNLTDVVEVTNADDDTAGFTIAESDGETSVSETGTTDTFTVVLNRGTVFSNVIIDVDSEDTGEGTVSPASLTFTPANWNVPQTITVTGVDDAIVDGTVNFDVVLDVNAGSALSYAFLSEQTVEVENIDNDSASITISNASGNEDNGPITVSATLNNEVTGGFTVDVLSSDGTATTASSDYIAVNETLTFAGTSGEVQAFEVVPIADAIVEENETVEVVMDNLDDSSLTVDISDTATITINNDDSCAAGTATPILNDTGTEFCVETFNDFTQNLNDYVDGTPPAGTNLVWSTNPDSSVDADYLGSTVLTGAQVVNQNTYYGFYYDSLNDCASPNTVQVVLSVNEEPNPGTTTGASVCADSGNGPATIDLDNQLTGADPGAWSITADPSGGAITIGANNVVDFNGQPFGNYIFTYTATALGICADQTVQLVVTVDDCSGPCDAGNTAPTFNGDDTTIEFCDEVNTDLNDYVTGTAPSGSVLTWSTSSDPTETAAHLNSGEVVEPGTYYGFYYDEVNDCGSPVLAITLVRNFTPIIDSTSGDSSCDSAALTLTATASVADESTISYTWYDAPTGGAAVGTSATFTTNTLSETTSFYVTASANGCESDRVEVVATINDQLSPGIPIEGLTVCNVSSDDGPTTFDLDDGLMGQDAGTWAIITDPSNGDATIGADNSVDFTGLASGNYLFEYTTETVGDCTETSSAQVILTVQDCISNEAIDLAITKTLDGSNSYLIGDEVIFVINVENVDGSTVTDIVISDVLDNDFEFLNAEASLGTYDVNTGEWNISEMLPTVLNATLRITVRVIEAGDIQNTATLVSSIPADDDTIDNNTDTVMVTVNRSQCETPGTICNIFSPNGDGVNDTLKLVGSDGLYTQASLEIFDRYGNSVFQMDGYDSSWDGSGKNGDLPKGTYFYVLDLNGDGTDVVKGWIQIVRDN